ncbi:hypothetical protein P3342_012838 [Pyrenophora teres f. teres]|uniref:Altered inheritance of mitochondria protein 6 n=1 Tax=Pyrenophora teres f. teres TaxID=97479 RepID=A0A6S6WQ78_9PLEO|nr:hypothetical protein P3342_012838 [Pyrenophora teres f. teres]CAE7215232.1 hypothetical protein PTTW11_10667 [Pyrenophora teres f. teres]
MLGDIKDPRRDEDEELSSHSSSAMGLEEGGARRDWSQPTIQKSWRSRFSLGGRGSGRNGESESQRRARRREGWRWVGIVAVILTIFGVIAGGVYVTLVTILLRRLAPRPDHSGLHYIMDTWQEPDSNGAFKYEWRDDFSRDIEPKNCHSHNDYWRHVPLYAALTAGCVSFEADIWLTDDNELLVSHDWKSTKKTRTLRSLYLDPLMNIFENRNITTASEPVKDTGVFDMDPSASTVLLIDFKSDGAATWPVLLSQLEPFRKKKWLTYYDGETLHQGPLTIVGTGNTPFDLVQANSTNRYVFFDAPLVTISDGKYNTTNSYYASSSLKAAVGSLWFKTLSSSQNDQIKAQVKAAQDKGLNSRYWDTPGWPIGRRDEVWKKLIDAGVGMLNVDDLVSASRWNWGWCVVAGMALCGNS